jgi:hypothetical protein
MWGWLVQNKQWVFDGSGIAALGVLWWLVKKFWPKGEVQTAPITTIQAPSIAPVITNTINFPAAALTPTPEPPKIVNPPIPAAPKPQPNLCVEAIKTGKISLEGDIWTLRPRKAQEPGEQYRGLLADISNVPTDEAHTAKAAIRAAIRIEIGGKPRTYTPLPWLEEFTNLIYLETGATKTVVLAVGKIARMGVWTFVLNHRRDYTGSSTPTQMDWTNQCPTPSDLPLEILMIDMNSGALLTKFVYVWTFDAENNWPILKSVD